MNVGIFLFLLNNNSDGAPPLSTKITAAALQMYPIYTTIYYDLVTSLSLSRAGPGFNFSVLGGNLFPPRLFSSPPDPILWYWATLLGWELAGNS